MSLQILKPTKPGSGFCPKLRFNLMLQRGKGKAAQVHRGKVELSGAAERVETPRPEADVVGGMVHHEGTEPLPAVAPLRGQWQAKVKGTATEQGGTVAVTLQRRAARIVMTLEKSYTITWDATSSTAWRWTLQWVTPDGKAMTEAGEASALGEACRALWERAGEVVALAAGVRATHKARPNGRHQDERWHIPDRVAALASPPPAAPVEEETKEKPKGKGKAKESQAKMF